MPNGSNPATVFCFARAAPGRVNCSYEILTTIQ
jgi:hypothetical protein